MEERMRGHGPGSPEAMEKFTRGCAGGGDSEEVAAGRAWMTRSALTSNRIPESDPYVGVVGAAWIVGVDGVRAAEGINGKDDGGRQGVPAEADAGAGLDVVGPILALGIGGDVGAPGELEAQRAGAGGVADAVLGIDEEALIEAVHVDAVAVVFDKPAGFLGAHEVAPAAAERDATAIVGMTARGAVGTFEIRERVARLRPRP